MNDNIPKAPVLTIDAHAPVLCTLHPDGTITGSRPDLCKPHDHYRDLGITLCAILIISGIYLIIRVLHDRRRYGRR